MIVGIYVMKNKKMRKNKRDDNKALMAVIIIIIILGIPVLAILVNRFMDRDTPTADTTPSLNTFEPSQQVTEQPSPTVVVTSPDPTTTLPPETQKPGFIDIRNLDMLKAYIEHIFDINEGKYGLSYYNLDTDDYIGITDQALFVAASSTKVPMVMYVYHAIGNGVLRFEDIVLYSPSDYEEGTGIIIKGNFGDSYTIDQLTQYAIMYSDNCAINMLIRVCGEQNMVNYMNSLGAKVDYIRQRWKTCPYDLMLYYKELMRLSKQNPELYTDLIDDLCKNTVAYQMSSKSVLPEDIRTGIKIGINTTLPTLNETLLTFANQTYILSYCSTDIVIEQSSAILKQTSLTVFEFVQNGYVSVEWDGFIR